MFFVDIRVHFFFERVVFDDELTVQWILRLFRFNDGAFPTLD